MFDAAVICSLKFMHIFDQQDSRVKWRLVIEKVLVFFENVGVRLKTKYFPKLKLSRKCLLRLSKMGVAA